MLDIDGTYGEGGGQLVRLAAALAAITTTPVRVRKVRGGRERPGLAAQHVAALRAIAEFSRSRSEGIELRSRDVTLIPGLLGGSVPRIDVGTAGSVTLVLQALLPAMQASGTHCKVTVAGGTDVRAAPPLDYLANVLLPLIERMGARVTLRLVRRGYFPRGGGEVEASVQGGALRPFAALEQGALREVDGLAHAANLPAHVAERMRSATLQRLGAQLGTSARVRAARLDEADAFGQGGAIVLWARSEHTVLGAGRVAERGVRAEALGEAVGTQLAADLASGATLDAHAADQMLVYLALARGGAFTTPRITTHAETAMWLIEQFLPVRFVVSGVAGLQRVEVVPRWRGAPS